MAWSLANKATTSWPVSCTSEKLVRAPFETCSIVQTSVSNGCWQCLLNNFSPGCLELSSPFNDSGNKVLHACRDNRELFLSVTWHPCLVNGHFHRCCKDIMLVTIVCNSFNHRKLVRPGTNLPPLRVTQFREEHITGLVCVIRQTIYFDPGSQLN